MSESIARTLADMLRSRIERCAELKSESISLGQYFAHQIHHLLTEIGNGRQHVSWRGDVPRDVRDPDRDSSGDWGLRARQVYLGGLSARAADGKWFATTNGADGLCRIDNGAEMFPLIGEWPEAELTMELVNAYRAGHLHDATALAEAKAQARRDAFEEAAREIQHQARSMRMGGIPCDTNEIKASTALSQAAAIRALATAPAETEKPETGEAGR